MATWREMGEDALVAAQKLFREAHYRSSVSRSYYAAYCTVTAMLSERRVQFPRGWKNPAHAQVVKLIRANFRLGQNRQKKLLQAMRQLREGREDADYRPAMTVDKAEALQYLKEAALVLKTLE